MPAVINGIGTWYYGRSRIHTLRGACEFCRAAGDLSSYDTTLFFTVFFIPVIPLGKKRILRKCQRCSKHRVISVRDWEAAKAKDSAVVLEKLRADPDDREAIMHALALATAYQDKNLFDGVAQSLASRRQDDAEVQTSLGLGYEYFSRFGEAESAYRQALVAGDSAEGRVQLGLNLLKQGRPEDAEPCLTPCYDSAGGAGTLYWLVAAYQAEGKHDDALRVIDAVCAKWPDLESDKTWLKLRQVSTKYRTTTKRIAAPLLGKSAAAGFSEGGWRAKAPRYILPALLLAGMLAYLGMAIYLGQARTVYLLGGSPTPYAATINGVTYTVGPGRPTQIRLAEGDVTVSVRAPGLPADEQTCRMETPFWTRPVADHLFVLNPDRVAVAAREVAVYGPQAGRPDEPDRVVTGELLHDFGHVDYVFEPFPPQIKVEGKGGRHQKSRVDVAPVADAEARLRIASEGRAPPDLQEYAKRWLAFQPDDGATLLWLVTQLDPPAAGAFLGPRLADRPVRTEWHRAYQVVMERGQPDRDLIPEYQALASATGRTPDSLYLLARLCPRDECVKQLTEATRGAAPSHLAENALGYYALSDGRFPQAVGWCRKAVAGAPGNLLMEMQFEQALWAAHAYDDLLQVSQAKLAAHPDAFAEYFAQAKVLLAKGDPAGAKAKVDVFLANLGAVPADQKKLLAGAIDVFDAFVKRDAAAYLRTTEGSGKPAEFIQAILRDQPDAAAECLRDSKDPRDGLRHGLVYLCADRLSKAEVADAAFAKYVDALRHAGRDDRAVADLLTGAAPTVAQLKFMAMDVSAKRVAVAVAIRKFPTLKAELTPFAARLNFEFDAEGLCLANELK